VTWTRQARLVEEGWLVCNRPGGNGEHLRVGAQMVPAGWLREGGRTRSTEVGIGCHEVVRTDQGEVALERIAVLVQGRRLEGNKRVPVIRTGVSTTIVRDSVAWACIWRQVPTERQSSLSVGVAPKLTRTRKDLRIQRLD
jgi:hypothetical protein